VRYLRHLFTGAADDIWSVGVTGSVGPWVLLVLISVIGVLFLLPPGHIVAHCPLR
jgi:hypothetical protein